MREVEEHQQAAMRRYGIQDEPKSGSIGHFHDPHAQERRACVSHPRQPPKLASRGNLVQGPSTTSELSRARADQTIYEHARLTNGRNPVDPFKPPNAGSKRHSARMLNQKILLEHICTQPQLIEHYPHTRGHLEKHHSPVPTISGGMQKQLLRHLGIAKAMTENTTRDLKRPRTNCGPGRFLQQREAHTCCGNLDSSRLLYAVHCENGALISMKYDKNT
jgi:hypothetical protein